MYLHRYIYTTETHTQRYWDIHRDLYAEGHTYNTTTHTYTHMHTKTHTQAYTHSIHSLTHTHNEHPHTKPYTRCVGECWSLSGRSPAAVPEDAVRPGKTVCDRTWWDARALQSHLRVGKNIDPSGYYGIVVRGCCVPWFCVFTIASCLNVKSHGVFLACFYFIHVCVYVCACVVYQWTWEEQPQTTIP